MRLSSGALRRREGFCFFAFFQHAGDGCNWRTRLDGGGAGDAGNQRLAEFIRVAQMRVSFNERFLFHGQIIADDETMNTSLIFQKLWNYCNVLRDDGMSYGDYPLASLRAGSEQLTYLLFLKMKQVGSDSTYQICTPMKNGSKRF